LSSTCRDHCLPTPPSHDCSCTGPPPADCIGRRPPPLQATGPAALLGSIRLAIVPADRWGYSFVAGGREGGGSSAGHGEKSGPAYAAGVVSAHPLGAQGLLPHGKSGGRAVGACRLGGRGPKGRRGHCLSAPQGGLKGAAQAALPLAATEEHAHVGSNRRAGDRGGAAQAGSTEDSTGSLAQGWKWGGLPYARWGTDEWGRRVGPGGPGPEGRRSSGVPRPGPRCAWGVVSVGGRRMGRGWQNDWGASTLPLGPPGRPAAQNQSNRAGGGGPVGVYSSRGVQNGAHRGGGPEPPLLGRERVKGLPAKPRQRGPKTRPRATAETRGRGAGSGGGGGEFSKGGSNSVARCERAQAIVGERWAGATARPPLGACQPQCALAARVLAGAVRRRTGPPPSRGGRGRRRLKASTSLLLPAEGGGARTSEAGESRRQGEPPARPPSPGPVAVMGQAGRACALHWTALGAALGWAVLLARTDWQPQRLPTGRLSSS
jgi:hypothetical protein